MLIPLRRQDNLILHVQAGLSCHVFNSCKLETGINLKEWMLQNCKDCRLKSGLRITTKWLKTSAGSVTGFSLMVCACPCSVFSSCICDHFTGVVNQHHQRIMPYMRYCLFELVLLHEELLLK